MSSPSPPAALAAQCWMLVSQLIPDGATRISALVASAPLFAARSHSAAHQKPQQRPREPRAAVRRAGRQAVAFGHTTAPISA